MKVAWLGENGDPIYSTRVTEGDGSTEVSVAAAPEYAAIAWIGDRAKFLVDIVCAPCAAR